MIETKQNRKTPLTTIAISQEYAKKLDEYLKGTGINRKEFVELSIDYFQRTGFDIRGEAFDLSPLEKITNRMENSAKIIEQNSNNKEIAEKLLQIIEQQSAKQLPAPDILAKAIEEKAHLQASYNEICKRIDDVVKQGKKMADELCRVRDNQKMIGKIKVNTDFLEEISTDFQDKKW